MLFTNSPGRLGEQPLKRSVIRAGGRGQGTSGLGACGYIIIIIFFTLVVFSGTEPRREADTSAMFGDSFEVGWESVCVCVCVCVCWLLSFL